MHITCPQCGLTSYNPSDVKYRYCGNCHQFHDMMEAHLASALTRRMRNAGYGLRLIRAQLKKLFRRKQT